MKITQLLKIDRVCSEIVALSDDFVESLYELEEEENFEQLKGSMGKELKKRLQEKINLLQEIINY
jgi:hypothetical protein